MPEAAKGKIRMPEALKKIYVWIIFSMSFFMIFTALGFGSSTKGTFLTAVTKSLGLERSLFTIADSLRYLTTTVMSLLLGKTVKKIGLRKMAGFGFTFLALSFTINSLGTDYWMFYIGGALLGAGLCWTSTSMVGYLVENWFTNGKGTIMGILLSANGLGGFASEFIVTKIVYGMDGGLSYEASRWRLGYRFIAILFLVVGILAVLVIRERPEDIGAKALGTDKPKKKKRGSDWVGYSTNELIHKPFFYVAAVCVFMTGFALQSMVNVAKPYMYDVGMDKNYVIVVFASHSLLMMASKILTGVSYDNFGLKITHFLCCLCSMISLGALCVLDGSSAIPAWVYALVSSFGLPLETVMVPLTVSYMFGKKDYTRVLGYFLGFNTLGYAVGVPVANLVYDKCGSYRPIVFVLTGVIAAVTVVMQISMLMADRSRKKLEASLE